VPKKKTWNLCGMVYYYLSDRRLLDNRLLTSPTEILPPPREELNLHERSLDAQGSLGKFSSRVFSKLKASNSEKFHGFGECAAKHWIGSQNPSSVVPYDLSNTTVDLDFVAGARESTWLILLLTFSLAPVIRMPHVFTG
jgi:hypothetical protein